MDTYQEKKALRKRMEALRSALPPEERREKSNRICRLLQDATLSFMREQGRDKLHVLTYVPFRTEVDVKPYMEWCWKRDFRVVVPKVRREKRRMELRPLYAFEGLEPGAYGIPEPRDTGEPPVSPAEIDLLIIPGLAFDLKGGRLGYGGGYYDRFVRQFRERGWAEPRKIAPAFAVQIIDEVPMDDHDVRVDHIVTENGVITPG